MNVFTPQAPALGFKAHSAWLAALAPDVTGSLIAAATDIALVLDRDGLIADVALSSDDLRREGCDAWVGRAFPDLVTVESRAKARDLIANAGHAGGVQFREINHPSPNGPDLPIRYSALRAGPDGPVILLGRDQRHYSALQRRLVEAQQAMEREYARLRLAETRYRMLFQLAAEAVLIVDAASLRIVEANPAAQRDLGLDAGRMVNASILSGLTSDSAEAMQLLLRAVRQTGTGDPITIETTESRRRFSVSASGFRQDGKLYVLVRLSPAAEPAKAGADGAPRRVLALIESLPDGFVMIGADFTVIEANRAFLDLAQLVSKQQAVGAPLETWLGRPGIDLPLLLVTLTEHGVVRNFTTIMRGAFGGVEEVEISAVPSVGGDAPSYGFIIRSRGARGALESQRPRSLPRSVEHLAELVGRVSLKDLVRETTDVIEKLCIEAALELSKDNRASAAQMLGLSRQSFYAKLRRYGLGDLGDLGDDEPGELN